jgi:hypothetical protein
MNPIIIPVITALLGILGGYIANTQLEKRRKYLATKREQLQFVYAPLEIITRINRQEFDRYFDSKTTDAEKEYIETHVWFPNNSEIRKILITQAHLLEDMPEEMYSLMSHINVWLSEYNLVHTLKVKRGPVFVAYKGQRYPTAVDKVIQDKAAALRKIVNK